MGNEKLLKKAEITLAKAEILMDKEKYKKSAEFFKKSGQMFLDLKEWKISEPCFFYASKNYHKVGGEKNFHRAS